MDVGIALRAELLERVPELTGVYPLVLPARWQAGAAATYQIVASPEPVNANNRDGIVPKLLTRVQIRTWAEDYRNARALSERVRTALLEGFGSGTLGPQSESPIAVTSIRRVNAFDLLDRESGLWSVVSDYLLEH